MSALSDGQVLNLLQALDELDEQIETLNGSKRDLLVDAREQMHGHPKKEIALFIAALKKAVADSRKARNKPESVEIEEERDALAEHFKALLASAPARRATPAIIPSLSEIKSVLANSRNTNSEAA